MFKQIEMTEIAVHTQRSKTDQSFSSTADSTDEVLATQSSKAGNIKVVCRFRPINERERTMNLGLCVEFPPDPKQVFIHSTSEPGNGPLKFAFDYVFPPGSEQALVYEAAAKPVVESVLEGFNGTVFAYGQTGSGKTFTMSGLVDDDRLKGIIPRMIDTVFSTISTSSEHIEFTVKIGYCEIYLEKIKDLLNPAKNNLKVHEDKVRGVFIADLTEEYVSDDLEVHQLMKVGQANREVAFTLMNEGSSRSHSLFIMTIMQSNTTDFSAKSGKLYLVDLAGSEKVGKTGAEGKRLDEAKNINKSLSTLGQVINALTDGKSSHVPYRDSKLTRVLQDSLGGNSKTSLIITASPSAFNEPETISTLRFGIRAKAIKNKPTINKEYTVAELKLLLSKAEAEIGKKVNRIQILESVLMDSGLKVPEDSSSDSLDTLETAASIKSPSMSADMEETQREAEELRTQVSDQTEAIITLSAKLEESEGRVKELLSQRGKMQQELNRMLELIRQLEEDQYDSEEKYSQLQRKCSQKDNKLDRLATRSEEMERTIAQLMQELTLFRQTRSETEQTAAVCTETSEQELACGSEVEELHRKLEKWERTMAEIALLSSEPAVLALLRGANVNTAEEYANFKLRLLDSERQVSKLTEQITQLQLHLLEQSNSFNSQLQIAVSEALEAARTDFSARLDSHLRQNAALTEGNLKLSQDLDFAHINYKNLVAAKEEEERGLRRKISNLEKSLEQFILFRPQHSLQKSCAADPQLLEGQTGREEVQTTVSTEPTEDITPRGADTTLESERTSRFLHNRSSKIKKTIKGGQKLSLIGMFSPFASFAKAAKEPKKGDSSFSEENKEHRYEKTLFRDT